MTVNSLVSSSLKTHRSACQLLAGLAVALLSAVTFAAPPPEAKPKFTIVKKGTQCAIAQDFFRIIWDTKRGGEITGIDLHDGIQWRSIIPALDGETFTIPALLVITGGKSYALGNDRNAKYQLVKENSKLIEISFEGKPKTAGGRDSGISAKQTFSIYKEGVIFCDLELRFEKAMKISTASVEVMLDKRAEPEMRRDDIGKHHLILWSEDRPRWKSVKKTRYTDHYVLFSLADEKTGRPWTNHVDFFVEGKSAIGGNGKIIHRSDVAENTYVGYRWDLSGQGTTRTEAGNVYKNRWGMGLGTAKKSGKLIGARIYHWLGRDPDRPFYPTDEALKRMADFGCNIIIFHDQWVKDHRRIVTYQPRHNEDDLKRAVKSAHRLGLRVMVYSRPYPKLLEKGGFFQKYLKHNWDGIYIDHGDADEYSEYAKVFSEESPTLDYDFAAKQYFLYTQQLRNTVGPGGILIIHTWHAIHGFGHVFVDGYLSGEAQLRMMTSPEACVEGMFPSAAVPTVWTDSRTDSPDKRPYLSKKAVGYYAGIGCFPHIVFRYENLLGPTTESVDSEGKTLAWPLWQIWRVLPFPYTGVYYNYNNAKKVVDTTNSTIYTVVYKADKNLLLVTAANLSHWKADRVTLELDTKELEMKGRYSLVEMEAIERNLKAKQVGTVSDGRVNAGSFKPFQYKGFLLTQGKLPTHAETLLKTKSPRTNEALQVIQNVEDIKHQEGSRDWACYLRRHSILYKGMPVRNHSLPVRAPEITSRDHHIGPPPVSIGF